jgi:hypothetical protein
VGSGTAIHKIKINVPTQITKELKITQILEKLLEYKRNWI